MGMCTRPALKDVLLDPPRSGTKRQAALAMITAVASERMFVLQMVQLLTEGEFQAITPTMQKLQALCARPGSAILAETLTGHSQTLGSSPLRRNAGGWG